MKKYLLTFTLVSIAFAGFSQENLVNLTGGYAWAKLDGTYLNQEFEANTTGWRMTGTYEYNPNEGKIAYGFSLGYVGLAATYSDTIGGSNYTVDYAISSIPLYFAPKVMFGSDKVTGFIKLAIGGQSTTVKRTGDGAGFTAATWGFYGGGGAGLMFYVHDNVFIIAEYEIAYVTNDYYSRGLFQSASGGIGVRF